MTDKTQRKHCIIKNKGGSAAAINKALQKENYSVVNFYYHNK